MSKQLNVPFYFLLLFFSLATTAQTSDPQQLTTVLEGLQERYGVQFNYASVLVEDVEVSPPNAALSLQESLDLLSQQTQLSFVFVSDTIISIKQSSIHLCGYLKDKDTGEALPYVVIQNANKGTIANDEGYFELKEVSRDDLIRIQHLGYRTMDREITFFNTAKCDTIYLVPNQEKLAEVTVYDFLVRGIDKLDNGAFQLDFDRFSILPGLVEDDVLQSVQALPGIQSIDETVSNITIRGGSHDQNLITWDGIKMYQSGHFFGLISMYNPLITQKVALRKNGSTAADTDGVSGTIAMKTDEFLNQGISGSIGVNMIDANGAIDAPIGKKASLQVAARKAVSDLLETPTYSQYFDRITQDTELESNSTAVTNSDITFDFYDASLRLLYHPSEKDRFRINFIHTANEVRFNEAAEIASQQQVRESRLDQSTIAGGIHYMRKWSEVFRIEAAVYNTDYKLKAINANIIEDQRFLQENKVSETGIRVMAENQLGSGLNWTNGYHFMETKVTNLDNVDDPLFIRLEGEVLRTHAVFTEIGMASKDKATQLNLGLRVNYLDEFRKQLWEPRLSFNHAFGKGFNVEVLGEFKHQSTSQIINFQNDFLGLEKRRWQLSNDETIPVLTSRQASVGLSFNQKGWLVQVVPFYKKVEGITTQSQGFQDNYAFVQASGSYDGYGLDLLLRRQFQRNSLWLGYSYLNSDYLFEALPETTFPNNFDITHALTLGGNYTINQILLAAGLNWRTGRPFTRPIPNNEVVDEQINYDVVNGNRMEDYLRLDFSAKYEFKWGEKTSAQIGVSVWNVLNRNNTINTFYRINVSEEAQRVVQPALSITPNASFRLRFN